MAKNRKIEVQGKEITVVLENEREYISLTDMLKAKDGDFFISDWLRNRNTVEYLGIIGKNPPLRQAGQTLTTILQLETLKNEPYQILHNTTLNLIYKYIH